MLWLSSAGASLCVAVEVLAWVEVSIVEDELLEASGLVQVASLVPPTHAEGIELRCDGACAVCETDLADVAEAVWDPAFAT
jgi:hypothetical protein